MHRSLRFFFCHLVRFNAGACRPVVGFVLAVGAAGVGVRGVAAEAQPSSPAAQGAPAASAMVEAAGLVWHADYDAAYREAKRRGRMLLVNFVPGGGAFQGEQQSAEQAIAGDPRLRKQLEQVVLLRAPGDQVIQVDGRPQRLLSFPAFADLQGGPGLVLIDLQHRGAPYFGRPVNVLPFSSGKYYRWQPSYLAVILNLPAGSLTQRTMTWAVRVHPERPQSTVGTADPSLLAGATQQASYQAAAGQLGHQNFAQRAQYLSAAAGSSVSEVCAESWPNQNMIDSCLDCVASWRHSSGHWNGVSRPHRAFGYDIRRGRNGIWYGTGIFAD